MSTWKNISLFQFQQIEQINATENMSELDKLLFSTCIIFDKTEYQLDQIGIKKAGRLLTRVEEIFSSEFKSKVKKRIGWYSINYDLSKISFGQFIDLAFFLSAKSPIQNAHYIIASLSTVPFFKYSADRHRQRSASFLTKRIDVMAGAMQKVTEAFTAFTAEYKSLFGLDEETGGQAAEANVFNKRYGWIYAAGQVAEYERISLDQVYELPVRQAFNDLSFLKAKAKYEVELHRKTTT